jgi:hypothetical protein
MPRDTRWSENSSSFVRRVSAVTRGNSLLQIFLEEHEFLMSAATIMGHYGAIYDVEFNQVPCFKISEYFVEYLLNP